MRCGDPHSKPGVADFAEDQRLKARLHSPRTELDSHISLGLRVCLKRVVWRDEVPPMLPFLGRSRPPMWPRPAKKDVAGAVPAPLPPAGSFSNSLLGGLEGLVPPRRLFFLARQNGRSGKPEKRIKQNRRAFVLAGPLDNSQWHPTREYYSMSRPIQARRIGVGTATKMAPAACLTPSSLGRFFSPNVLRLT